MSNHSSLENSLNNNLLKESPEIKKPPILLSPIYAEHKEIETPMNLFSNDTPIAVPFLKQQINIEENILNERKNLFENEPLIFFTNPDTSFNLNALQTFANNQHNKSNM